VGNRPQTTWTALALAVVLMAGLSACGGGSGPAALSVRCTGRTLPGPDSTDQNDVALPATPTAVAGIPHAAVATEVPVIIDPADPHHGYDHHGWEVVREAATGGRTQWSATIRPPGTVQTSDDADLSLSPYTGYVIATGGNRGQDIAAVSAQGTVGPVCALPPYDAFDGTVALLPHAGIVIAANPTSSSAGGKDYWLNGYSTATGKRIWSADTRTSEAERGVGLVVSGDTAYVWQEQTGDIAAYDARTGHRSWLTASGTTEQFPPGSDLLGVSDAKIFVLADQEKSSRVEALNSATGKIIWRRDLPEPVLNNQISLDQIGTGLVAVAGSGRRDYLLDAADGTIVSSLPVQASAGEPQLCTVYGEPAVTVVENGALGVLSSDQADNRTISIPPGKSVGVAVASTMAYVRAEQANAPVYGYNLATGRRVWTMPVPRSVGAGNLYAVDGGFALQQEAGLRAFT
jgi:outer membrane protein assembly factor BamB